MFNSSETIPLVFFGFLFFLVFIVFLTGTFLVLTAKGDGQKLRKGKNLQLDSFYAFFIVLLISLVFLLVTYLLKKGQRLRPSSSAGEFPSSPAANYPPPPRFIKIGKLYFDGPWALKGNNFVAIPVLYSVLCKKDNGYDIIYIGNTKRTRKAVDLLKDKQYNCWLERCGKNVKNLYIAFQVLGKGQESEGEKIRQTLENQINPVCGMPDSSVKLNNNNSNNE